MYLGNIFAGLAASSCAKGKSSFFLGDQ